MAAAYSRYSRTVCACQRSRRCLCHIQAGALARRLAQLEEAGADARRQQLAHGDAQQQQGTPAIANAPELQETAAQDGGAARKAEGAVAARGEGLLTTHVAAELQVCLPPVVPTGHWLGDVRRARG